MNEQLDRPSWKLEVVDLSPFGPAGSSYRLQQTPGFSLPASFQRIITLRSESASCCSLKKVEVQVGPKLGRGTRITNRFFTTHRLLVVLVRDMHHSLNTHIDKMHTFLCDFQPLHYLQRTSQGLQESASAFRCRCPGRYWISNSKVLKNTIQRAICPSGSLAWTAKRKWA